MTFIPEDLGDPREAVLEKPALVQLNGIIRTTGERSTDQGSPGDVYDDGDRPLQ